jgi:hypothetical protein
MDRLSNVWPPNPWRADEPITSHAMLVRVAALLRFHQPGWSVEWRKDVYAPGNMLLDLEERADSVLVLHCKTVDTYTYRPGDERRPEKSVEIVHMTRLPPFLRVGDLPHWFREQVHRALAHEADEWLRIGNWMAWDPHSGAPKWAPIGPQPPGYRMEWPGRDEYEARWEPNAF